MSEIKEEKVEGLKIKKPSYKKPTDKVFKVDLTKKQEDAVQEPSTEKVDVRDESGDGEKVGEAHKEEIVAVESKEEKVNPIVEVTEQQEKPVEPKIEAPVLPDNINKLVDFMKDTGGDIEDYVRLNTDYSKVDPDALLLEYYKTTKPHLDKGEIEFLIEDKFSYDEDEEEEKQIKKKQLAAKEELAKARTFFDQTKQKYYDEIKIKSNTSDEGKKALDFLNTYNKEQEIAKQRHETFQQKTKDIFNDFKGFDFKIGDKTFKYNVNNSVDVAAKQSNLNTFVKKFLNKEGEVVDAVNYHKAIYAADNADAVAKHFYEQGKADATKDIMAKSNNITNEPRPQANGDMFINGLKVRAISGADSSRLKIKRKYKNNN
jgi:hypothetical protein